MEMEKSEKIFAMEPKGRKSYPYIILILILIGSYVVFALGRGTPALTASAETITVPKSASLPVVSWPADDESAVGAVGYGVLAQSTQQTGVPIASIAKTMLGVAIENEKPLKVGEQGPTLTMTANDVKIYKNYLAQNGSIVPIREGEQMSEYQMLEALLLPSGDNIADSLAIWGFGSTDKYLKYANDLASKMGLKQTHFADASGLSPQTVSSAHDLVILGEEVMKSPVLAEIVGKAEVTLPEVGLEKNYNSLLGEDGIIGIKTGNTDEAGGCLLFAAKKTINGQEATIVGAILGAVDRAHVLLDTKTFLDTNANAWQFVTVAKAGQTVGNYGVPWGGMVTVTAKENLSVLVVNGSQISVDVKLNQLNVPANKGAEVGTIIAKTGSGEISVKAVLDDNISPPKQFWKLTHP